MILCPTDLVGQVARVTGWAVGELGKGLRGPGVNALTLPFSKRTPGNGMDVVVHENHHVPIIGLGEVGLDG